MAATANSRPARLSAVCFLVTAASAIAAGILCLHDRSELHKAIGFHAATFDLRYPLIRSFVAAGLLASIIGLVAACVSLRGATRIRAATLWLAAAALLVVGVQRSPAHYMFSQPHS